jgi:hypothetical protein
MTCAPTIRSRTATSLAGLVAVGLALSACLPADDTASPPTTAGSMIDSVPPAPISVTDAEVPVTDEVQAATARLVASGARGVAVPEVDRLAMSGDLRQAWVLVDLLRFQHATSRDVLVDGLGRLTNHRVPADAAAWRRYAELLLHWDVPAPPGFLDAKRTLYAEIDPAWSGLFDEEASLDWRRVTWSGVASGDVSALEAPAVVPADQGGDWLPDDEIVFGLLIDGEARAYPHRVLEAHGVVNDALAGRPVALSHCASSGVTRAFDRRPFAADGGRSEAVRLRLSGLASSVTRLLTDEAGTSLVDPLLGTTVAGPLHSDGSSLEVLAVRTTTWAMWRQSFPDTTVIADDAGIGRVYPVSTWSSHGEQGPSLAAPPPDDRLPVQEAVLAVSTPESGPVAFPVRAVDEALDAGAPVTHAGIRVVRDAGGLTLIDAGTGRVLAAVAPTWRAWSGAWPETEVWTP